MFRFPEQQKTPRRAHSPLWLALRPSPESDLNDVSSGKVRYRAGWLGILIGTLVGTFAFLASGVVFSAARHSPKGALVVWGHRAPKLLALVLPLLAFWGAIVLVVGMIRVVEGDTERWRKLFLYLFIPLMAVVLICVFVFEVAPLFAD